MCRDSLHQHGPGSDTEPPASGWWTVAGLVLAVVVSVAVWAGIVWLARRVWGVL